MKSTMHIECLVALDSLKTIGIFLLTEGMYQIRVQLYYESQVRIPITPRECYSLKPREQQYIAQHIIDNYYMSDALLLRQWTEEERFRIDNACRFGAWVPVSTAPLFLEVELLHYDLSGVVAFQSIALSKYLIQSSVLGVYEYIPIILGDDHFTLVNSVFCCSLTDVHISIPQVVQSCQDNSEESVELLRQQFRRLIDPMKQAQKSMQVFLTTVEVESDRPSYRNKSYCGMSSLGTEQVLRQESNISNLTKLMATDYKNSRSSLTTLWGKVILALRYQNAKIFKQLRRQSLIDNQVRFQAFTFKENIPVVDHSYTMMLQTQRQNQESVDLQTKRQSYAINGPSKIIDFRLLTEIKDKLVIHERHYTTRQLQQNSRSKLHLIVFVHGYQGHSYDMRMLENYMCMRFPQHMLLVSLSNQNNTEGDILSMGRNLSEEIKTYISTWSFTDKLSISFIAHSLGGLIVRAALPFLDFEFHTLMTLASPHLGYLTNNHTLINIGMWILQKFKKSQCLAQLNCNDDTLLKLSQLQGMNKFKNIILLGSKQDHYVTNESCLLLKINGDNIHNQMATNILKQLHQNEILRITVDYKFNDGDLDTFLGRKAHVAILESHFLNSYIIYNLGDYFR